MITGETQKTDAAPIRLVALGDSMAQGFTHGSVRQVDWSFPALVARACRLAVVSAEGPAAPSFVVPSFAAPGIPLDVDDLLVEAEAAIGRKRSALQTAALLRFAYRYVDALEDRFERQTPIGTQLQGPPDHLGIAGLTVRECRELNSAECDVRIKAEEGSLENDLFALPSAPLLRVAKHVLNAAGIPSRQTWSPLRCLRKVAKTRKPNVLLLSVGNADILGALASLRVLKMPVGFSGDRGGRRRFNVTAPDVFEDDFQKLASGIDEAMRESEGPLHVFVGTLPLPSIAPFVRGLGNQEVDGYYPEYGRFFVKRRGWAPWSPRTLSGAAVRDLDAITRRYNAAIRKVAAQRAGGAKDPKWHVVEVEQMVSTLAVKRNGCHDTPEAPLRRHVEATLRRRSGSSIRVLLDEAPVPDARLYRNDEDGRRLEGGLFGLDGGHPSPIGYGLVAELFVEEMAKVPDLVRPGNVPWRELVELEASLRAGPRLWGPVLDFAEANATLLDLLLRSSGMKLKEKLVPASLRRGP